MKVYLVTLSQVVPHYYHKMIEKIGLISGKDPKEVLDIFYKMGDFQLSHYPPDQHHLITNQPIFKYRIGKLSLLEMISALQKALKTTRITDEDIINCLDLAYDDQSCAVAQEIDDFGYLMDYLFLRGERVHVISAGSPYQYRKAVAQLDKMGVFHRYEHEKTFGQDLKNNSEKKPKADLTRPLLTLTCAHQEGTLDPRQLYDAAMGKLKALHGELFSVVDLRNARKSLIDCFINLELCPDVRAIMTLWRSTKAHLSDDHKRGKKEKTDSGVSADASNHTQVSATMH